jgi:hypothetical protein
MHMRCDEYETQRRDESNQKPPYDNGCNIHLSILLKERSLPERFVPDFKTADRSDGQNQKIHYKYD